MSGDNLTERLRAEADDVEQFGAPAIYMASLLREAADALAALEARCSDDAPCEVCEVAIELADERTRSAALLARVEQAEAARAWLAERFAEEDDTCEPDELPLRTLVERCFKWGDGAWHHAGKELERADAANSRLYAAVTGREDAESELAATRQRAERLREALERVVNDYPDMTLRGRGDFYAENLHRARDVARTALAGEPAEQETPGS